MVSKMVLHTSGVCFFELSDPGGLMQLACRVPPFCRCIAFCFQAASASALLKPMCSNSHWVIISAFSFLTYWTAVISTQKHALKQPLKAAVPCLHYPIFSSQQTSLRLWPFLVIISPSCLPATIPQKLLLSESR